MALRGLDFGQSVLGCAECPEHIYQFALAPSHHLPLCPELRRHCLRARQRVMAYALNDPIPQLRPGDDISGFPAQLGKG